MGMVVVAHVQWIYRCIPAKLRIRSDIADSETCSEIHRRSGDATCATVVLEQIVIGCVFLTAVVKNSEC